MSSWTNINGVIDVDVPGRSQTVCDFILNTVLDHLPLVTGSEGAMDWHVNKCHGQNNWSTCDEFGQNTNLARDYDGHRYGDRRSMFGSQCRYTITISCGLRDRVFDETLKEFSKWICRLSKRIYVGDVLVKISDYEKSIVIDDSHKFNAMYVRGSWNNDKVESQFQFEHCVDWRYGQNLHIEDEGANWTELLINIIPGGLLLSREIDVLSGLKDPYNKDSYENYLKTVDLINEVAKAREDGSIPKYLEEKW